MIVSTNLILDIILPFVIEKDPSLCDDLFKGQDFEDALQTILKKLSYNKKVETFYDIYDLIKFIKQK